LWYCSVPRTGNRADDRPEEGYRVRFVASLDKSAGISVYPKAQDVGRKSRRTARLGLTPVSRSSSAVPLLPANPIMLMRRSCAMTRPCAMTRRFFCNGTPDFRAQTRRNGVRRLGFIVLSLPVTMGRGDRCHSFSQAELTERLRCRI